MIYPPSLPANVKARAFRSGNDELGILPADTSAFLAACRSDGVEVLGWELWIVGHSCDPDSNLPVPADGSWCGLIPVSGSDVPVVIGGEGDLLETERQLAATNLALQVQAAWLPHARINFTLDG